MSGDEVHSGVMAGILFGVLGYFAAIIFGGFASILLGWDLTVDHARGFGLGMACGIWLLAWFEGRP